jgi:DNA mismatch endonuclease, patch repair protein
MRDPATTSRIMRAVRSRDTGPELVLRRALHKRGLRYRLRYPLPGRPDLVFPTARLAVFVDGDFWHGNTWRLRGAASLEEYFAAMTNAAFWQAKIRKNIERDHTVNRRLQQDGWRVLRLWESDLHASLEESIDMIERVVRDSARLRKRPTTRRPA